MNEVEYLEEVEISTEQTGEGNFSEQETEIVYNEITGEVGGVKQETQINTGQSSLRWKTGPILCVILICVIVVAVVAMKKSKEEGAG